MSQGKVRHMIAMGAPALVLVRFVPTFLAQQSSDAPRQVSYFSQFLHTGNMVGNLLVYACVLISIAVVSLIIDNVMHTRLHAFVPPDLYENLERLITERNYREAIDLTAANPSPLGEVMRAALIEAPQGYEAMEEAIEDTADAVANKRVRSLIWLEVAGAAGPMLGLFGTVFGMILAFQQLVAAGGSPKASELAGGIATALVCTFWGLVVGIPGVVAASIFRVRIEGLTEEVIASGKALLVSFRAAGRKGTGAQGASPAVPGAPGVPGAPAAASEGHRSIANPA